MDQDKITQRLADMVWQPPDIIAKWLSTMGIDETYRGEHSIGFYNPRLDVFGVIGTNIDPNTNAVSLAFLLAGMSWPEVYPNLQPLVNREWKRRTKGER